MTFSRSGYFSKLSFQRISHLICVKVIRNGVNSTTLNYFLNYFCAILEKDRRSDVDLTNNFEKWNHQPVLYPPFYYTVVKNNFENFFPCCGFELNRHSSIKCVFLSRGESQRIQLLILNSCVFNITNMTLFLKKWDIRVQFLLFTLKKPQNHFALCFTNWWHRSSFAIYLSSSFFLFKKVTK